MQGENLGGNVPLLYDDMPVHCLLDSFWFWSRLSLGDGVMEIYANEFPRGGSGSNNYWISSGQGRFGKYQTIFPSFWKMLILLFPNSWFGCMDLSFLIIFLQYNGNHFGELLKNSTTQNDFGKNRSKNVTVLSKDDKQQYCETFSF